MLFMFIIVFIVFWFLYSARKIHLCQNTLLLSDIYYYFQNTASVCRFLLHPTNEEHYTLSGDSFA